MFLATLNYEDLEGVAISYLWYDIHFIFISCRMNHNNWAFPWMKNCPWLSVEQEIFSLTSQLAAKVTMEPFFIQSASRISHAFFDYASGNDRAFVPTTSRQIYPAHPDSEWKVKIRLTRVRSTRVRSTRIRSTRVRSTRVRSARVRSTRVRSTKVMLTKVMLTKA